MVIEHFKNLWVGFGEFSHQQGQASGRVTGAAAHVTQTVAWG